MKAWFDDRQRLHDPKGFIQNGIPRPNPEQPERVNRLLAGVAAAGCAVAATEDHGLGPIAAVHAPRYLHFLQTVHARWIRVQGAGDEVIPNVHPLSRATDSYPGSPAGLAGFHQADTACPIGPGTWEAAYWSAQTALSAAAEVAQGRHAYALCRPPGHHAYGEVAGGFCFLNNTAIAARWLAGQGHRVAVLDVDVHHGNGTQGIFYDSAEVLTVSIHADPAGFYPFYFGHAGEHGSGAGAGYNLNLPLARGSGDDDYWPALDAAINRIALFGADRLVIALGLDAAISDPFQALRITTPGFHHMARRIAGLGLPSLLVQEGGYLSEDLTQNLASFLAGFTGN
jgi:acetoin utilization deacetylase AcuC-like enzyme